MQIKQLHKTLEDMRSTRHLMNRRGINNFFYILPKISHCFSEQLLSG